MLPYALLYARILFRRPSGTHFLAQRPPALFSRIARIVARIARVARIVAGASERLVTAMFAPSWNTGVHHFTPHH